MNKDTDKLIDKEPENVTGGAVTDIDGSCKEKKDDTGREKAGICHFIEK